MSAVICIGAGTLEAAGASVLHSYEHLKVHSKLLLIERREQGARKRYAYLGTGNFNERTARIYADSAPLTTRPSITADVAAVFGTLPTGKSRSNPGTCCWRPTG
ncbi:MAG: hypothetical protein IPG74_03315 [Flavobacteriales bacterium]|nr:hypothetical protein [Flavobacteriales bacterium]